MIAGQARTGDSLDLCQCLFARGMLVQNWHGVVHVSPVPFIPPWAGGG
jgi:hypothetical protein